MSIPNISLEAEALDYEGRVKNAEKVALNEDTAAATRDLIAEGVNLLKRIEDRRKTQKQPHLDAGREIDAAHEALASPVKRACDALKAVVAKYLQAIEAQRRAEAARAEEEARKAAEAAKAEDDPFARFDAETAAETARDAARIAAKPVNLAGREAGRAASLRTYYLVEVTDAPALVQHFVESQTVIEAARVIAQTLIRASKGKNVTGIPGIKIIEDKRVA